MSLITLKLFILTSIVTDKYRLAAAQAAVEE